MSATAIYNVTRGLRMLLRSQLARVSPTAVVTLLPPGEDLPNTSGLNLYLYRVIENPFFRNEPWRGDRVTPPTPELALSLQLFYLVTPLGTRPADASFEQGDDAHTMLGVAMRTLHENPILNDTHIPDLPGNPGFDSDVVLPEFVLNNYEQVKIALASVSLEDLSKIWATINQPYRLSVAYEISLVQITPTPPPQVDGGIVLRTNLEVLTLDAPRLSVLVPSEGALARLTGATITANTLEIRGSRMSFPGQKPIVRIGGQVAAIQSTPAPSDESVTVTLPNSVDAGPQVDVMITLNKRLSTPLAFFITPWLSRITPVRTAIASASTLLVLEGSGFTTAPQAVRFTPAPTIPAGSPPGGPVDVSTFQPGGSDIQASVVIPATLANGMYEVRLVIAGGSSSNPRSLQVIPLLVSATFAVVIVGGRQVHRLTLTGQRLTGSDLRLLVDGVVHAAGPNNASSTTFVYTLGRLLGAGAHTIAVQVDGQTSHTMEALV